MSCDICVFVSPCSVCARSKTSHQPSAGLLRPLPIPNQPWSHIVVTALPPLNSNTTIIFTGVDHFSKAVYFVPLSKLPTASETADLLVLHIFQLHGILHDMMSQTVDHNSPLKYDRLSVEPWAQRPACCLVTISD